MQYIAFDSHEHSTLASVEALENGVPCKIRIVHERGALREFLRGLKPGSPAELEATGTGTGSTTR